MAKTSLKKAIELKAGIYAAAEIQEYWVLDLAAKQAIVFRKPQAGRDTEEYAVREGTIIPLAFSDVLVSIDRLLP